MRELNPAGSITPFASGANRPPELPVALFDGRLSPPQPPKDGLIAATTAIRKNDLRVTALYESIVIVITYR